MKVQCIFRLVASYFKQETYYSIPAAYGGIYLDLDEVLLRPLHVLRKFPYTQGHELPTTIGSQLILAARDAPFLALWSVTSL